MSLRKLAIAGTALTAMMASTAYASVIDRPFFQVLGVVVVWGADDFNDGSGTIPAPIVSDFVVGLGAAGGTDLIAGDVHTVLTGSLAPINAAAGDIDAATFDPVTGAVSGGTFTDAGTTGVLDAADTLSAFEINDTTDVDAVGNTSHESSFYVASNTNFEIRAHRTDATVTGGLTGVDAAGDVVPLDTSNITWDMAITVAGDDGLAFGDEAQDPTGTGTGVATLASLASMSSDVAAPTPVFVGSQRTAENPGTLTEQSVRFDLSYELDTDLSTTGNQGFDLSSGVGTISSDVTYTIFVP